MSVPTWAQPRFFDVAWIDRPGGYQAAAELAAAKKVIALHRGGIEVLPGDRGGCRRAGVPAAVIDGGCRLVMLLPTV